MTTERMRFILQRLLILMIFILVFPAQPECVESCAMQPGGGRYVPPPFEPVFAEGKFVRCLGRKYDMAGVVPMPFVDGRPVLIRADFVLNGNILTPPQVHWTLKAPALAIVERSWLVGSIRCDLKQIVEYDGFITCDLTLWPMEKEAAVQQLVVRLEYQQEASVMYHIPVPCVTWAGLWPQRKKINRPFPGIWCGNDTLGFESYVGSFSDWLSDGPLAVLSRKGSGTGMLEYRIIGKQRALDRAVTWRFGFIATPVRPAETRHWRIFALPVGKDRREHCADVVNVWKSVSDYYATFRTNNLARDAQKKSLIAEVHKHGKKAIAYTTYAHVEESSVKVPYEWTVTKSSGEMVVGPCQNVKTGSKRIFLCPGNDEWIDWKKRDIEIAVKRYNLDGFYVDTSYINFRCNNNAHGHGWVDAEGDQQADYTVWSMRKIWKQAYETICRERGRALIYAHHKYGCPAALAAFTTAFCDGEQYTAQPIRDLTLNAFRAQIAGRNKGPFGILLCEYYRAFQFDLNDRSGHHNPLESLMLALLNDCLASGYPGNHPICELIELRDDLGITDAYWTPYYSDKPIWKTPGAVVSSYQTKQGDTLLVVGNPSYRPVNTRLIGPIDANKTRTFVLFDISSRIGRTSSMSVGYRWETDSPLDLSVDARSVNIYAFVHSPRSRANFAEHYGFLKRETQTKRHQSLHSQALLVDDFDDPDWILANDLGEIRSTNFNPVDTSFALSVIPKPVNRHATLDRYYPKPRNWKDFKTLSLWVRPDNPQPVRALHIRLRNRFQWTAYLALESHSTGYIIPSDVWTRLEYTFGSIPRERLQQLRIYFNRDDLNRGRFDLDEIVIFK